MPTKPANIRSRSARSSLLATGPDATASTRRPAAASSSFSASRRAPVVRANRRVAVGGQDARASIEHAARRAFHVAPRGSGRADGRTPSASVRSRTESARRRVDPRPAWAARCREPARRAASRHRPGRQAPCVSPCGLRSTGEDGRREDPIELCVRLSDRAARSSRRSNVASHARTHTTVMSPEVSVRVLSVQTIVVDPSDSTAGRRRTSA